MSAMSCETTSAEVSESDSTLYDTTTSSKAEAQAATAPERSAATKRLAIRLEGIRGGRDGQ